MWGNGATARFYPAEKCHKFRPELSFLFTPNRNGTVTAGYYLTGACSGPPFPIYGDKNDPATPLVVAKEYVDPTACLDMTYMLQTYNITGEHGISKVYGRFYTAYSAGGSKYGQRIASSAFYSFCGSKSVALVVFFMYLAILV